MAIIECLCAAYGGTFCPVHNHYFLTEGGSSVSQPEIEGPSWDDPSFDDFGGCTSFIFLGSYSLLVGYDSPTALDLGQPPNQNFMSSDLQPGSSYLLDSDHPENQQSTFGMPGGPETFSHGFNSAYNVIPSQPRHDLNLDLSKIGDHTSPSLHSAGTDTTICPSDVDPFVLSTFPQSPHEIQVSSTIQQTVSPAVREAARKRRKTKIADLYSCDRCGANYTAMHNLRRLCLSTDLVSSG